MAPFSFVAFLLVLLRACCIRGLQGFSKGWVESDMLSPAFTLNHHPLWIVVFGSHELCRRRDHLISVALPAPVSHLANWQME